MDQVEVFFEAIRSGDSESVSRMLSSDPRLAVASHGGVSAIRWSLYCFQKEVTELLQESATELSFFDACALGELSRVLVLLVSDPAWVTRWTEDGFQGLHLACAFGGSGVVRALIEAGADLTVVARNPSIRVSPIHAAAFGWNVAAVRALLDAGVSPDLQAEGGFAALHTAAANGNEELAEVLLEYGAKRNIVTDDGKTPLDLAQSAGHSALIELLEA